VTVTIRSTPNLAAGPWQAIAVWTAAEGWTIPPGVAGVSLSLAINELLDNSGASKSFYRIGPEPAR
jgi:hypothetical protein